MTTPAMQRPVAPDDAIRQVVLDGLHGMPKTLPPKLFYDDAGARLFELICECPEYHVTRTELSILEAVAGEVAARVGPGVALVEYGSGAGRKVRLLLAALEAPGAYVPIDISGEQLARVGEEVSAAFPALHVHPVWADFTRPVRLPSAVRRMRPMAFFPGSTIGNFHPTEAAAFLRRVRRTVGPGGTLLLGVDRPAERAVLEAAYDDAAGVTAAFNRNLLVRLNRELGADFDVAAFAHRAVWNAGAGRIEMHLVSARAQRVRVAGSTVAFAPGESIWTESSYKYDAARLDALVAASGFELERRWSDDEERFWVVLLRAPVQAG